MVDLTDAGSPFQQSIPDFAFYVPAVVVFTLAALFGYKLYKSLTEKELKKQEKLKSKQQKKAKKSN
ncbi:uncharacterized protein [Drosophila suzukii]|uniref:Uncharacterized protein LOC108044837 isoform X4 n=3 Tax=melanogaster group TaxID=32346 RepID=A0A6P4F2C3_DRORH|nr:uncharacterized protein LOC6529289 isoform X3 [Drosophila yakuba]XP_016930671.1 uncharacterized protein LOC108010301 isoform X3 [Drosophila suzukii]XP_016979481.1 uncharacterized protein LOC108044837 isoform X4 [Drosophila rhopaloa]XP_016994593.1 uncharacterized protein LOC108055663 isoform X2 [Drosophila takahashii]XP_017038835.1 uncharacterized protein LOC108086435 isoform X3 [Drosophila ficusphila]XP_037716850.1 uncharacterized protein LOC119551532 isoform X3 [Drosophila subpulchrella]X